MPPVSAPSGVDRDSELLLTAGDDNTIHSLDASRWQENRRSRCGRRSLSLAVTADGQRFAAGLLDGRILIYTVPESSAEDR